MFFFIVFEKWCWEKSKRQIKNKNSVFCCLNTLWWFIFSTEGVRGLCNISKIGIAWITYSLMVTFYFTRYFDFEQFMLRTVKYLYAVTRLNKKLYKRSGHPWQCIFSMRYRRQCSWFGQCMALVHLKGIASTMPSAFKSIQSKI